MNAPTQALAPVSVRSQRLMKTEVFDAEYYAAESGKDFASKRLCAISCNTDESRTQLPHIV